ncbi:MFS general substrate transporter [Gloeophyllum trabeum ATCC 11539]|uniref:MFS general substrate transporter n=1 Tax=Gloeophyllum trabeum (strain ATCC 11539 / FP-39264 / Madison 617) TaxID=670483 RepID=S7QP09_GLOTA|nr:MFS general substrate transporter [Gloeophyllum trabeum ATCC 11539]EPQ61258.1 MFS general substrate transporter [Gloeophyllum trabeum ATCC 11539]
MGLGVLEDKYLGQDVPGTCLLDDLHAKKHGAPVVDPSRPDVKRSKDGIILVPQPSDSPNDPLNWPTWRKMALMLTITYGAGIVGAFGPIIGAGLVQVAENLNTDVSQLSEITGDTVLAIGLVLFLTAPASVVWGRRPIFLIGNVLLLVSCIWSALAKSVGSLTAARVVGGAGMAPIECLVEATIGDIFFVHERGTWIALWSFALLAGIYGVSIVNGYLIQDVSWRACFWIEGGLCGLLLILTILFVPETAWVRPEVDTLAPPSNPSPAGTTDTESSSQNEKASDKQVDVEVGSRTIEIVEQEKPYSYWRYLKLFEGRRYTSEKFWRIATRPFILICSPCVAWGALVYGTTQGWVVGLSVSISLLFSTPEYGYNFGAGAVGLMSGVGPFIATLLANAMAGPLSDYCVKWMARRNGGIYEPEFRLVLIIPTFFFQVMGWFGWAVSAHLLDPWIAPIFFYSVISFGLSLSSIAVVSYVVDAHPHYAPESFATINASKNIFVFGLTYYIIDWLNSQGVLKCFSTIGGLVVFVCVMTIPMYIYGKRARSWVHRTPWMLS